ncbi:MAG: PTS sugar transporter subunit IIB [Syntrophus sp. SKADARSKE-3]|nr:PTS sugar transporter subunit IIB [Syntrophus sp. SKADARSKE-3]
MDIALVRVDNRLVHGQIIEAWVPYVNAGIIFVVDDDVANDFFRETVIKMAVPREVEVLVYSVDAFAASVPFKQGSGKHAIVLFSNISDALRAFNLGFKFRKLNVGNVYNEDCRRQLSSCVLLSDQDMESINKFLQNNVQIELRRVPREKPSNVLSMPDALNL